MKRIAPIIGVVLLIIVLVLVNRGISKSAHPDDDDDAAPASQPAAPAKQTPPPAPVAGATTDLPAETTVGDPSKAKYKITVGWVYDDANQANPQSLRDALQAVQQVVQSSGGTASAEIVDLDVPADDLSPLAGSVPGIGVALNGQPVSAANPGETGAAAPDLARMLQQRLSAK